MTFSIALAWWQLEFRVDIPSAASEALQDGMDTPSLRVLAGLGNADRAEVAPILRQAAQELGIAIPTRSEAALAIVANVASGILRGDIAPHQGAETISKMSQQADFGHRFDPFIYGASELDEIVMMPPGSERDQRTAFYESYIVAAARDHVRLADA